MPSNWHGSDSDLGWAQSLSSAWTTILAQVLSCWFVAENWLQTDTCSFVCFALGTCAAPEGRSWVTASRYLDDVHKYFSRKITQYKKGCPTLMQLTILSFQLLQPIICYGGKMASLTLCLLSLEREKQIPFTWKQNTVEFHSQNSQAAPFQTHPLYTILMCSWILKRKFR